VGHVPYGQLSPLHRSVVGRESLVCFGSQRSIAEKARVVCDGWAVPTPERIRHDSSVCVERVKRRRTGD
jgi:hypothetical protein